MSRAARGAADAAGLLEEGRALHAQGRPQEAFARYQRALALEPGNADAMHLLGVAYATLGQPAIGLVFLQRAVAARPAAADFRVNLATTLGGLGRLDEAEAALRQACAVAPGDVEVLAALAALQRQRGDDGAAEESLAGAAALAPQRADLHEALAQLQYRRGAVADAQASALRAIAADPRVAERINVGFVATAHPTARPPVAPLLRGGDACADAAALAQAAAEREIVVWDDFLPDPLAVRAQALALCGAARRAPMRGNFPGTQSLAQDCAGTMQRIADALGRPLRWDSPDTGAWRVSLAADDARADVHVDNPTRPDIFGGVLCLTLPAHCRGGTSFYRHRASGWTRRPDPATLRAAGYATFLDFQRAHVPPNRRQSFAAWQAQRHSTWEWLFEVPLRFNRLVVFRSDFFHAISELFGELPENGRLVQLFHFEAPVAAGA